MDSIAATTVEDRGVAVPAQRTASSSTVESSLACRCGHDRDEHEHFRAGTDCGACGCARFRRAGRFAARLTASAGRPART